MRLAFDELVAVPVNRQYFQQMGRDLMSTFLTSTGHVRTMCQLCPAVLYNYSATPQDPTLFCERFDALLTVLEDEEGRRLAEKELRQRRVRLATVPIHCVYTNNMCRWWP